MNLISTFLELDKLYESVEVKESTNWIDRDSLIKDLQAAGKNYNFSKYTDAQLYRMWERIQDEAMYTPIEPEVEKSEKLCPNCGEFLNTIGECPHCDLFEYDLHESKLSISDLKTFYETATGIDREKYPNFFVWYDAQVKSGKFTGVKSVAESMDFFGIGDHVTDHCEFPNASAKYACIMDLKNQYYSDMNHVFSDEEVQQMVAKHGGRIVESVDKPSEYHCSECGHIGFYFDSEVEDLCCPVCHDHHGGFYKVDLTEKFGFNKKRPEPVGYWEEPTTEVSSNQAVSSTVDDIKAAYEAGLFNKMPVGRDNAATASIYGPDKDRLVGYFSKLPEFEYEMNNDAGIISHEFISDSLDIEIFDEFISVYKIPQNESVKHTIKENLNKEINKMNFQTILEDLNKLYEAKQAETEDAVEAEADSQIEAEVEADEAEVDVEIVDDEVAKQLILECASCGAIILKDEAEVEVDAETDLANVKEECQYCEKTEGYTIIGEVAPYESDEDVEDIEDDEASEDETVEEGLFDFGKKKREKEEARKKAEADFQAKLKKDKEDFEKLCREYDRADIDIRRENERQRMDKIAADRAYERQRYNSIKADKPSNTGYTGVNYSGGDYY